MYNAVGTVSKRNAPEYQRPLASRTVLPSCLGTYSSTKRHNGPDHCPSRGPPRGLSELFSPSIGPANFTNLLTHQPSSGRLFIVSSSARMATKATLAPIAARSLCV